MPVFTTSIGNLAAAPKAMKWEAKGDKRPEEYTQVFFIANPRFGKEGMPITAKFRSKFEREVALRMEKGEEITVIGEIQQKTDTKSGKVYNEIYDATFGKLPKKKAVEVFADDDLDAAADDGTGEPGFGTGEGDADDEPF